MRERDRELVDHFTSIGVDMSLIALPWFLCFFIGYVPWEVTLRILDDFFAEGPNVLLQVHLHRSSFSFANLYLSFFSSEGSNNNNNDNDNNIGGNGDSVVEARRVLPFQRSRLSDGLPQERPIRS